MAATLAPMVVQTPGRNWICGSRSCVGRRTAEHRAPAPALQHTVDRGMCRTTAVPIRPRVGEAAVDRVARRQAVVDVHTVVAVEVVADRMVVEVEEVTLTAAVAVAEAIPVVEGEDTPAADDVNYKS